MAFFLLQNIVYISGRQCMELFAGQATEEGSRDGPASYCRFYEATGIAVEFDNVVYVFEMLVLLKSQQN